MQATLDKKLASQDWVLDPSLVLYLPLHQLDGSSFMSKDKHGHLCAVTGALWRPNGHYFDGSDDYIDCGDSSALTITSGTIEVWAYRQNKAGGNNHWLVAGYNGGGGYVYWTGGADTLAASAGTIHVNGNGASSATEERWQHIAVSGIALTAITNSLKVGTRHILLAGNYFEGYIGEVRIYNRALTPLEIQHNYQATKWRYR